MAFCTNTASQSCEGMTREGGSCGCCAQTPCSFCRRCSVRAEGPPHCVTGPHIYVSATIEKCQNNNMRIVPWYAPPTRRADAPLSIMIKARNLDRAKCLSGSPSGRRNQSGTTAHKDSLSLVSRSQYAVLDHTECVECVLRFLIHRHESADLMIPM